MKIGLRARVLQWFFSKLDWSTCEKCGGQVASLGASRPDEVIVCVPCLRKEAA